MKQLLSALSIILLLPVLLGAQQISSTNYTTSQANATISSAYLYVNTVNESGYLIFQPNLSASYKYLALASQIYNKSPDSAVSFAQQAQALAEQQYGDMTYYKSESLPVITLITLVFLLALAKVMYPVKLGRKGNR